MDFRRDLYDHAFVLHALGVLYQATNNPRYLTWIDETLAMIDYGLSASHGGWAENDRRDLPRRQNPHMHLFEASLALYETTGEARHLARAGEIFGLFRSRFFDEDTGFLREFFGPAWEISQSFDSERIYPGHMAEWAWLLRRYQRVTAWPVDRLCATLLENAIRLGRDSSGFLRDLVDLTGRPLVDRRRLWPQTEYLKALIVEGSKTNDSAMLAEADAFSERLFSTYLSNTPSGTWLDEFTVDGELSATGIPASTLYHLFAVAVEILQHLPEKYNLMDGTHEVFSGDLIPN